MTEKNKIKSIRSFQIGRGFYDVEGVEIINGATLHVINEMERDFETGQRLLIVRIDTGQENLEDMLETGVRDDQVGDPEWAKYKADNSIA